MHLELRQLRYFIAVAEELHFGRAAQRLHMTQPPLSQTIQALEELLGGPLFLRNRRAVALTPAGAVLLPEARRMLLQASEMPELVRRAGAGEAGRIALAFVSSADYSVLPPFLRTYRAAYPQVQITLQEATTDRQIDDLMHARIDAGLLIAPLPDKARIALNYIKVLSEPLILAAPTGLLGTSPASRPPPPQNLAHAGSEPGGATNGGAVWLRDVPRMPLIIFPRHIAPGLHDDILACFRAAGVTPEIGQEAIQMQTIVGLVSAGMGLALVPQSVSNLMRPGVEYRALHDATPQVETGLAWRRDNTSPVLAGFLDLLRKTI